jgi:hypothetical protein
LYIDYENHVNQIKNRGLDLAQGRSVNQLYFKAYDRMSQHDVGLFEPEYQKLEACIAECNPGLLIIDPLRYALAMGRGLARSTQEEVFAINAIENISTLRERLNPSFAIILVHPLQKGQELSRNKIKLCDDPLAWIELSFGSQALLAHVDTVMALEQDGDHYVLATVPRAHEPIVVSLEKQDPQCFFRKA